MKRDGLFSEIKDSPRRLILGGVLLSCLGLSDFFLSSVGKRPRLGDSGSGSHRHLLPPAVCGGAAVRSTCHRFHCPTVLVSGSISPSLRKSRSSCRPAFCTFSGCPSVTCAERAPLYFRINFRPFFGFFPATRPGICLPA